MSWRKNIFSHNDLSGWVSKAKARIEESIFNSEFNAKELHLLDLKANSALFPELVNRDTAVRQRPLRNLKEMIKMVALQSDRKQTAGRSLLVRQSGDEMDEVIPHFKQWKRF